MAVPISSPARPFTYEDLEVEAAVAGDDAFETDWPFPVRVVPGDLLR